MICSLEIHLCESPRGVMSERRKGDEGVKDVKHPAAHLRLSHVQFRGCGQLRGSTCHGEKVGEGGALIQKSCNSHPNSEKN